jgi:hypothetical protein
MKMPDGDPPTEPNGNRNLNFILNDRKWKDAYLAWAKDQLNYENLQFLQAVETFKNQNTTWEMAVKIKKDYLDNDFINLYDDIKTAFMKRFDSLSPSG